MLIRLLGFNTYLWFCILVGLGTGCQSTSSDKPVATIRLHMEVNDDGSGRSQAVPIFRAQPSNVTVEKDPFLSEAYLKEATVVDSLGGFAIRLTFDEHGTRALDLASATYKGQRVAIFSQFSETEAPRWLGAPRFTRHITDGILIFTPDASREEADRIALGLNTVAAEIQKRQL